MRCLLLAHRSLCACTMSGPESKCNGHACTMQVCLLAGGCQSYTCGNQVTEQHHRHSSRPDPTAGAELRMQRKAPQLAYGENALPIQAPQRSPFTYSQQPALPHRGPSCPG